MDGLVGRVKKLYANTVHYILFCEISGSHNSKYEDDILEGYHLKILFCYLLNDEMKLNTIQIGIFTIASEEGTVTEVLVIVMNI
jgi:hypothetical protein